MNTLLLKHRPKDSSKEEFTKMWDNLGYSLEALYKCIHELSTSCSKVREDDFAIHNHYALLAYQAGKKQAYQEVMDLLPKGAKIFE